MRPTDVHRTPEGRRCGESHPRATHTDAEVEEVRALHDRGLGWRRIAAVLGLSPNWVKHIVSFRRRPFVRAPAEMLR